MPPWPGRNAHKFTGERSLRCCGSRGLQVTCHFHKIKQRRWSLNSCSYLSCHAGQGGKQRNISLSRGPGTACQPERLPVSYPGPNLGQIIAGAPCGAARQMAAAEEGRNLAELVSCDQTPLLSGWQACWQRYLNMWPCRPERITHSKQATTLDCFIMALFCILDPFLGICECLGDIVFHPSGTKNICLPKHTLYLVIARRAAISLSCLFCSAKYCPCKHQGVCTVGVYSYKCINATFCLPSSCGPEPIGFLWQFTKVKSLN